MRIGHGYDVHRLVRERELILGGVHIPHETGLDGHSDADVLVHAVMDALLGALALGDIGTHFPDNAPELKGIDSLTLLTRVNSLILKEGYKTVNIDATIVAESPKLAPFIREMAGNIAGVLELPPDAVSVKATTEEGLGFTGRRAGIAAHALALLDDIS